MILIDTNVISELMRAAPSQSVLDWFGAQDSLDLFLTAVTEAELRTGAAVLPTRKRKKLLLATINALIDEGFVGRVMPFDSTAAKAYAKIDIQRRDAGRPIMEADCQIAAIARAYGWFLRESRPAIVATSGRKRINIHGILNLEDGLFRFVEAEKINAATTRQLLQKLESAYPLKRIIHVFLDNARYHHAKVLQPWLQASERRIKLHFLPAYAPHLNPIERLWGVMHKHVTHSRHYAHFNDFTEAILNFFRKTLPQKWLEFRDTVTDNFRVITDHNYQLIG